MAEAVVGIQPKILVWARETAGYSLEEVAQKLKRDPADIADWETGRSAPTYAQLERLAYELYKRPLAIFFFPEPPQKQEFQPDFPAISDGELEKLSPDVRYLLRLGYATYLQLKQHHGDEILTLPNAMNALSNLLDEELDHENRC
ncbi:MAG: helix-turn-helix domain-containing protein [Leptolyngbyaceae bacterium]|nr:helix-turn-helix domain-containing protein [Leptolyngbyaceae bacterium]